MPLEADSMRTWSEDMAVRQVSLTRFAKLTTATDTESDCALGWADGRYLLFHFDLATRTVSGGADRTRITETIRRHAEANGGARLGQSVYALPMQRDIAPERAATAFWNSLCDLLEGVLLEGDAFYLHYPVSGPAGGATVGASPRFAGIAQVIPVRSRSLTRRDLPSGSR